jgi:hypothetical protein
MFCLRTFCPAGRFVPTDVLSLRTFCLYGCFVPTDVLSHGRYVSGCFVSGRFVSGCFVPTDVLSPDVLSGHRRYTSTCPAGEKSRRDRMFEGRVGGWTKKLNLGASSGVLKNVSLTFKSFGVWAYCRVYCRARLIESEIELYRNTRKLLSSPTPPPRALHFNWQAAHEVATDDGPPQTWSYIC